MEKLTLTCPYCGEKWAEIKFDINTGQINPNDVKDLISDKKFTENDVLACTGCGYKYKDVDLMAAYLTAKTEKTKEEEDLLTLYNKSFKKLKDIEKNIDEELKKKYEGKN